MEITCPHCDAPLRPKPEWAGRTVTCKKCNGRIVLPNLPQAENSTLNVRNAKSPTTFEAALDTLEKANALASANPTDPTLAAAATSALDEFLAVAAESRAETDAVISRNDAVLADANAIVEDSALAGLREKMADAEVASRIALTASNAALASYSDGLVDPEACEDAAHALKAAAMKFRVVVAESEILSTVDLPQATLLRSKAAEAVIRCEDTAATLRNTAMNAREAAEQALAETNAIATDPIFAGLREKMDAAHAASRKAQTAQNTALASFTGGISDPDACESAVQALKIAAMKWRVVVAESEVLSAVDPHAAVIGRQAAETIVLCEESASSLQSTAMYSRLAVQQAELLHNLQSDRTGCFGVIAIVVATIAAASAIAS